ncbi:MAG: maltose ABC transporter substrate-binding protein [Pseudomonadota bacterium]
MIVGVAESSTQPPDATLVPEPGAKLIVWETEDDGSGAWIQSLAAEFTKLYGVPITYEPVNHTDASARIAVAGPAKTGADVFCAVNDHVGKLVAAGLVYENDLSDPSLFMASAIKACSIDGKLYGYPTAIETSALIYNTDLVTTPPETWGDVLAFDEQFTDLANKKYGFLLEPNNFYFQYAFLSGNGGYTFGKNGTDPNDIGLNNAGSVAGVDLIRSFQAITPLISGDITYDMRETLFREGKLAMHLNGPWAIQGYKDAKVPYAVMPLPLLANGEHPISFSGVRALYVSSYTDFPNAAKLFAMYCTSRDALLKRYLSISQLPPRLDLLDDPLITIDKDALAFLQQAQYSESMPSIPEMAAVWAQTNPYISGLWDDPTLDTKAELDKMVQSIMDANALLPK